MDDQSSFRKLFEPILIGSMELKNRIVMPPMGTNFGTADGHVTEQSIGYYEARARGGVGLVIVEVTCIDAPVGKTSARQLVVDDDRYIPGLRRLADVIHRHDVKAVLQLHHAGRGAKSSITGVQPVAPSAVPMPYGTLIGFAGEMPRALTVAEIKDVVARYARAARRAREAGFDGVEIHSTGYYLPAQFLSSTANQRQDEYGGDLQKRARFLLEIIAAVRGEVGKDCPLLCKLSAVEIGEGAGLTAEEGLQVARMAQDAGVDAIEVAGMLWGVNPRQRPSTAERPGGFLPLIEAMKKVVTVPVMAAGRMDPVFGEKVLQEGKADLVVMGKGLIADPDVPMKAVSGSVGDIRPCIGCLRCIDNVSIGGGSLMCSVNAAIGKEREYEIQPAARARKVLVVGGGPAGMEAARVAALRGHKVTLYEKRDRLGGQLLQAVVPPKKDHLSGFVDYLTRQMAARGVDVRLGSEATAELIEKAGPDAVILAAGVVPVPPGIPGVDGPNVLSAKDVLSGATVGARITIIGGGVVGCETAEFLADLGKDVTVLEMMDEAAAQMVHALREMLLGRLAMKKVSVLTGVECRRVTGAGVEIATREGVTRTVEADNVVLASGDGPNRTLLEALSKRFAEVHPVGDCVEPQGIAEAVADGYRVALAL